MCGRFTLTATLEDLQMEFALSNSFLMRSRYNIAPGEAIPLIREPHIIDFLHWGFQFPWQKDPRPPGLINARIETAAEKPGFRQSYREKRCLIPANGYYEWKTLGRQKQPFYIRSTKTSLFAFGGIWSLDTFAILTRNAIAPLDKVHERMPVLIPKAAYDLWLNKKTSLEVLNEILARPWNSEDFKIYPVSPKVNNPRFDLPACIQSLQ